MSIVNDFINGVKPIASGAFNAVTNNPVSDFLFGTAKRLAQDAGTGAAVAQNQPQLQQSQTDVQNMAQKATQLAMQTTDPAEKARLLAVSKQALDTISNSPQPQFSSDINKNYLTRGITTGMEVGTGADLLSHPLAAVQGVLKIARHPIKAVQGALDTATNLLEHPIDTIKPLLQDPNNFKLIKGNNIITDLGNKELTQQYKNPGSVARDPVGTVTRLADNYNLTSPAKVQEAANVVTGTDGIVNRMVENAVKVSGPVNTDGIINNAQNLINDGELISSNAENKIMSSVKKSIGAQLDASGAETMGQSADPNRMLETLRTWEGKANFSGDPHSEAGQIASVYRGLTEDLQTRLFVNSGADMIVRNGALLLPEDAQRLALIHPNLLKDVQSAQTVGDLRGLQSDFVQGSKMAGNNAKFPSGGINLPETAALVTGHPLIAAAQTGAGKEILGNTLRGIGGLNGGLPQLGVDILGQTINNNQQPTPSVVSQTQEQGNGGQNGNNHPTGSVAQNTYQDQSGNFVLPTSTTAGTTYMSDATRRQLEANMTPGTPEYTKVEQQFANEQTQAKSAVPQEAMSTVAAAPLLFKYGNMVKNDIDTKATSFLNSIAKGKYKDWQAYFDDPGNKGNAAPFVTELAHIDQINKQYSAAYAQVNAKMGVTTPGPDQLISPGDSASEAQTKLAQMMQYIGLIYDQYKVPYLATSSPQGTLNPTTAQPEAGPVIAPQGVESLSSSMLQNNVSLPSLGGQTPGPNGLYSLGQ